jgi:anti-sigma factor RsiW
VRLRRRPLACQEVVELVTDYLEGALPRGLARAVERHLAGCPNCRAFVEQVRAAIRLARALPPEEVGDDVLDALTRAFEEYHDGGGDPPRAAP